MTRRRADAPIDLGPVRATVIHSRSEKDGKLYWRARTTGTPRQTVWTGWGTRDEVVAELGKQLASGKVSRRSGRGDVRTVADLLDRWSKMQRERNEAGETAALTLANYRKSVRHWLDALGDVTVGRLSRELVEDTLRGWRRSGVAARTVAFDAGVISQVVRWGRSRGMCGEVELQRLPSAVVHPEEYVACSYTPTREEADAVLNVIPPGRGRDVIELLAFTGARAGEIGALRVSSYDREKGTLALTGRDILRSRRGKVPLRNWPVLGRLGDLLERLVEGRGADDPLVQDLPGNVPMFALRVLDEATEKAGVPRFTPHGLRRLVVMELLDVTDPATVSKLTGHSVMILLRNYVRPRPERLRDAVAQAHRRRGKVIPFGERGTGTGHNGPTTSET